MLQRIKRLIKLSGKDPKAIEALTETQIDTLPSIGDGNAVFISEGTEAEYLEQEKVDKGISHLFGT